MHVWQNNASQIGTQFETNNTCRCDPILDSDPLEEDALLILQDPDEIWSLNPGCDQSETVWPVDYTFQIIKKHNRLHTVPLTETLSSGG